MGAVLEVSKVLFFVSDTVRLSSEKSKSFAYVRYFAVTTGDFLRNVQCEKLVKGKQMSRRF